MSVSCVTTCTGGTAEAGAAAEEVVATDMTVAAEAAGAVSATALSSTRCATPALSGNRCRPPASQERDSAGSHHEDQLLGTRGPPTASSSTGFSLTGSSLIDAPVELGGPGGSEAGLAPLKDGEQESSDGWVCAF